MANLQIEIISQETMKPSSPTPPHLRNYKFSFLDQCYPRIYMPVVLFYPDDNSSTAAKKSTQLKNSLPEILSLYYPLAGRIADGGLSVDCNDEGVEFFQAKTDCSLSDVLEHMNEESLNQFFPSSMLWNHKSLNNLFFIQLSVFSCGGIAIGLGLSHKFGDASTLASFFTNWAAAVIKQTGEISAPQLISAMIFPPDDAIRMPKVEIDMSNTVRKRFIFTASKIADLKAKYTIESGTKRPTRVEVVTAQLHKSAKRTLKERPEASVIIQNVNLRKRMNPPLPENIAGNFVSFFPVLTNKNGDDLNKLMEDMRGAFTKLCGKFDKIMDPGMRISVLLESFTDLQKIRSINMGATVFKYTSWCRFPLYEVDFKWGKPIWFGFGRTEGKNTIILTDAKGGEGVEAWVTMEEEEMAIFERDEELLSYANCLG